MRVKDAAVRDKEAALRDKHAATQLAIKLQDDMVSGGVMRVCICRYFNMA